MKTQRKTAPWPLSMVCQDPRHDRARDKRRSAPIRGYFGLNGSGKSWAMVHDVIPDLEAGMPCLSTVRLLDYKNPRMCELDEDSCDDWGQHNASDHRGNFIGHKHPHPLYEPLREWRQVLDLRGGNILLDEITGVADSNGSALPPAVANVLPQLRRNEVALSYTSIDFMRTNIRIREMTRTVNMCESFLPTTAYDSEGNALMWKQRRLSKIRTYDAANLKGDLGDKYVEKLAESRLMIGWHWIPGSPAGDAYSTLDQVLSVGRLNDAGRCVVCDGTRRAVECGCADYQERKASRTARTARKGRSPEDGRDGAPLPTLGSVIDSPAEGSASDALDHAADCTHDQPVPARRPRRAASAVA